MKQTDKYICMLSPGDIKKEFVIDFIHVFSKESKEVITHKLEVIKSSEHQRYVRLSYIRDRRPHEEEKFNELEKSFNSNNIPLEPNKVLNLSVTQYALIDKIQHMYFKGSGFRDIIIMLDSFKRGVKRLKTCQSSYTTHDDQYEWVEKNGNEKYRHKKNLIKAHFKWDRGVRYTLPLKDINKIIGFIKPITDYLFYEDVEIY